MKKILSLVLLLLVNVIDAGAAPARLACVGDSITEGMGVRDRGMDAYPARLAGMLGPAWEVRNFGVSGATLIKSGDKPYDQQRACKEALTYKADVVVIALGTNDTKPQNIEAHPDDFEPDYRDLIAKFRAANPEVKIFVCLPVPVFPENWGIRETVLVSKIIPAIQKVAAEASVPVIDLHAALTGKGRCFSGDRVHPNEEGTFWIARTVFASLTGQEPPPFRPPVQGITIFPLGDSITAGAGDTTKNGTGSGYRDRLAELLAAAGVKFQFVGSMMNQCSRALRTSGQDYHEGHGSYSMPEILGNLDGFKQGPFNGSNDGYWLTGGHNTDREALMPDIVLLLAGTNDIQSKTPVEEMQRRMILLLDWFQKNRPDSKVFVGTLVPYDDVVKKTDNFNGKVKEFNAWLAKVIPEKYSKNVYLVDLYSPFMDADGNLKTRASPDGIYLADGVHPSHNAYMAMGEAWFKAIHPFLSIPASQTSE